MNCTLLSFMRDEPITVGGWFRASVFHTRMTRSSPRASMAARCLPSGAIEKLDILGKDASCSIDGGVGLARMATGTSSRATRTPARRSQSFA